MLPLAIPSLSYYTNMIAITEAPINTQEVIAAVQSPEAGAINVFIGTVRNQTQTKAVMHLDFEAYDSMAVKKMQQIADEAASRWPIRNVAIVHRKGTLQIGDAAVVIAVSTPHRKASFEACEFIIDTLKEVVPIWKKEFFEDGAVWVAAHP